jgi:hypothetical protein
MELWAEGVVSGNPSIASLEDFARPRIFWGIGALGQSALLRILPRAVAAAALGRSSAAALIRSPLSYFAARPHRGEAVQVAGCCAACKARIRTAETIFGFTNAGWSRSRRCSLIGDLEVMHRDLQAG